MPDHFALILLLSLQVADGWTTYKVLKAGGRELNPLVRIAIEEFGLVPGLIVTKGGMAAVFAYLAFLDVEAWALWGLCGLYVLILANNVRALYASR